MKADSMLDKGELDGAAVWRRIVTVIMAGRGLAEIGRRRDLAGVDRCILLRH